MTKECQNQALSTDAKVSWNNHLCSCIETLLIVVPPINFFLHLLHMFVPVDLVCLVDSEWTSLWIEIDLRWGLILSGITALHGHTVDLTLS